MKILRNLVILACLSVFAIFDAHSFVIRAIYIQPTDASAPRADVIQKFKRTLEDVRYFYRQQMETHGYGPKTFRLQTNNTGEPIVQIIRGRHDMATYGGSTASVIDAELHDRFNSQNTIYVVLVGGLEQVAAGKSNGNAKVILADECAGCRGTSTIAERSGNFLFSTVAHELGHAFGLRHNLKGQAGGNFLMWFDGDLEGHEARWLNANPYFNNQRFSVNQPPRSTRIRMKDATIDGDEFVIMEVDIQGSNPLYQAWVFRNSDHCVLAWDKLCDPSDTAELMIRRSDLSLINDVWIQFIDNQGNQALHSGMVTIPLTPVSRDTEDTDTTPTVITGDSSITYLTILSNHPDAIRPTNNSREWDGWVGGIWEKDPDGKYPPKPRLYVNFPFQDQWHHWFYSHAPSQYVWDLRGSEYSAFDCKFYLPHPCDGDLASIEMRAFVDDTEIYSSGELRPHNAQNKNLSFDIPQAAQTLEIRMIGLDTGACDHFVLGEPRLIANAPAAPSKPKRKTTTVWAALKKS